MKLKVVELFSGIGAQSKALKNIGIDYEIVATSDWDIFANISYACIHHNKELMSKTKEWESIYNIDLNNTHTHTHTQRERERERERERLEFSLSKFSLSRDSKNPTLSLRNLNLRTLFILNESLSISNNFGDIKSIKVKDLPKHNMITYSFPCQDLSLQGSQKGLLNGKSSSMLWEVERIIKDLKKENRLPKYLVMENVKSLFSSKYEKGFNKWKKILKDLGYTNHPFILNAKYFGVPQNRERAFMVSELNQNKFIRPKNNEMTNKSIGDVLDKEWIEWQPTKGKVKDWNPKKNKNGIAKSIIEGYTNFQSEASVFSKKSLSPTITATGALNRIKVIEDNHKLRMLNSKEQWQLMGFSKKDWELVNELNIIPEINLKKQAGNSIVVQVMEVVFKNIK